MGEWRDLHDGWVLTASGDPASSGATAVPPMVAAASVPATVPGCVHTDLLAAGLIADPYLDRNEHDLAWTGHADWRYATTFAWQPGDDHRVDLVCEGLDTVARVELNGTLVGTTQNMHRSYRFDVGAVLRPGDNELVVTFGSAQRYAEEMRDRLGDLPGPNSATPEPFNFIRKMACNFGWDWGPDPRHGRDLEADPPARLEHRPVGSRPSARVRRGRRRQGARGGRPGTASRVSPLRRSRSPPGSPARRHRSTSRPASRPRPWTSTSPTPTCGGRTATATSRSTTSTSRWPTTRGRSSTPGAAGSGSATSGSTPPRTRSVSAFTLVVNDVPIFARGANWIPDDCFPSRVDAGRYRARLQQAKDANLDLLRVWGGGLYEKDEFYEAADELGILVWQDFLFACAAYPEESPLLEEVDAEARENVARLMSHPSLVIWNGNNENIWGYFDWGWEPRIGDRTWGKGYYLDILPRAVAETDPTRPYWPGSPYSGSFDVHPNVDEHGCKHIWDVWNQRDYSGYRDYVPRFVAEFGFQGPPTWATLTRAVHDEPLAADSPGVLSHQKATDGNLKLARGLAEHFDEPATVEDWHWLTQLNQARALTYGIEHFRSHRGRCMGTVVWQLNDCWPVTSWAAVDGDARRKPLWYALRRVYDPRLLTVQPREGGLEAVAVNDGAESWTADVVIERRTFAGEVMAQWTTKFEVPGRNVGSVRVPLDVATASDAGSEVLVVTAGDRRTTWYFAADKHLAYPAPELDVEVVSAPSGGAAGSGDVTEVRVSARSFVRDLALFADRIDPDASADDMLVTLMPGETHTFRVAGLREPLTAEQVGAAPVLRCANDAVTGPG